MTAADRQRVTVAGPTELVIDVAPTEVRDYGDPRPGERIAGLRESSLDRALGRRRWEVVVDGWRFEATVESAAQADLRDRAARAAAEHQPAAGVTIRAQIPGRVARLWVAEGDEVEQGQRLLAVDAMKMENEIRAPRAGRVAAIRVEVGRLVERNDELLSIG